MALSPLPAATLRRGGRARTLAATAIATACWLCACDNKPKAPPPPPPPDVETIAAGTQDVPVTGEWIGTTAGLVDTQIRARVSGYLIKQNYKEGGPVKAGDLLFEIDRRPFEVALAHARADMAQAQAAQGKAEIDENRLRPLAATGAVSREDYDNAIQANLAAKAGVQAAQATVDQANLNLVYTNVVSPVDGIAGIANAQLGDLVGGPTPTPLTVVSTLDPIKVYFPISEQEFLRFTTLAAQEAAANPTAAKKARPLELILSDGTVYSQPGAVSLADRQVDPTTGTIRIAALFPNPESFLRPGQYARVRAVTRVEHGAVVIPQRAVTELQGTYMIAVVDEGNKVSIRPVKVGPRVGSNWVISQGLEAGETVVVEGTLKVREGVVVNPVAPKAEKPEPKTKAKPPTPPAAGTPNR